MQEIQDLSNKMEIERMMERSASKIAQLYKQEQSTNIKKEQLRDAADSIETKIEALAKKLKENQDLMRLLEPRFGLLVTTSTQKNFTLILRSESQREEWIRELNQLRKQLGQVVNREAEISMMEKQKSKREGVFGDFSKSLGDTINKTVMMSAQALQMVAKSFVGDHSQPIPKSRMLPSSSSKKGTKRDSEVSSRFSVASEKSISTGRNTMSNDSISPADTHTFVTKSFKRPTHCDLCGGSSFLLLLLLSFLHNSENSQLAVSHVLKIFAQPFIFS